MLLLLLSLGDEMISNIILVLFYVVINLYNFCVLF